MDDAGSGRERGQSQGRAAVASAEPLAQMGATCWSWSGPADDPVGDPWPSTRRGQPP